ncbi:MAG: substrate-binding domain-containing protein [Kiritimatiellia bacterium]
MRLIQLPHDSIVSALTQEIDAAIDGIIVTTPMDETSTRLIAQSPIPAVFVDVRNAAFESRAGASAFVRNDNDGVGAAGADYLSSLGAYNSYGFVPNVDNSAWSAQRERAFTRTIKAQGHDLHVFRHGSHQLGEDLRNLSAWLKLLPKPAAVMAAFDYRAVQVSTACAVAKLEIPRQVTLLGVDDDVLLCQSVKPPLSSIKPDHEAEGFRAAAELQRLFRLGKRAKRRETLCRIVGVVERESTKACPPAATLVRRATAFIDGNLKTNLKVDDIAGAVGVSRRLLEQRFREVRSETVHGYILRQRLKLVKSLLKNTRRTSARIARECGFANANSLSHIFRRATGCSMRDYRNRRAYWSASFRPSAVSTTGK